MEMNFFYIFDRKTAPSIFEKQRLRYCRFKNVRENLPFADIREFVASRILSSR